MTTIDIVDHELEETVASVSDDGSWDAETMLAEEILGDIIDDDNTVMYRTAEWESESGDIQEQAIPMSPEDDGYLYVIAESLPWPLQADEMPEELEPPVDEAIADGVAEKMWDDLVDLAKQRF